MDPLADRFNREHTIRMTPMHVLGAKELLYSQFPRLPLLRRGATARLRIVTAWSDLASVVHRLVQCVCDKKHSGQTHDYER